MKKTRQKKSDREMAPRKPIAFDGLQLNWYPFATPQRYEGTHPLGVVIVRPCSIPEGLVSDRDGIRTGYRHDGWACFLNNALLGRALRPGEAAKRGEKWLRTIRTAIENAVARELRPQIAALSEELTKQSRDIGAMLRGIPPVALSRYSERPTLGELRLRGVKMPDPFGMGSLPSPADAHVLEELEHRTPGPGEGDHWSTQRAIAVFKSPRALPITPERLVRPSTLWDRPAQTIAPAKKRST